MAVGHSLHKGRIAQIPCPDGGQHGILLFHKPLGLGQDDEVPLVADGLKEADGDGIGNAAVQQAVMADLDDLCGQWHGSRGFHPAHILRITGAALMIDRVAGADIGADHKVIHGGFPESLVIERVELFGHLVVAEILTVQVAGAQQIAEAGIAFVVAIGGVVADGPPDLVGFVVAAEHCSRRNTYHTVYRDALLHQNIQNTGGEHAPHGTAFQDQSGLHTRDTPSPHNASRPNRRQDAENGHLSLCPERPGNPPGAVASSILRFC